MSSSLFVMAKLPSWVMKHKICGSGSLQPTCLASDGCGAMFGSELDQIVHYLTVIHNNSKRRGEGGSFGIYD